MIKSQLDTVKHPEIFLVNHRGEKLMTDSVIANTDLAIVRAIDDIQEFLLHQDNRFKVVIHCLYDPKGHVGKSYHYVRVDDGKTKLACAVDFHILFCPYIQSVGLIREYYRDANLQDSCGYGIYPNWQNPGHHFDVRGYRARWGFIGKKEVSFDLALAHAKKLFGKPK
ncbi:MAG: hypothetical protein C4574_00590 [Candidatus Latescibacterota bacterium]|jgi:hypothetical protein|nr:MAG: hypothetical protein C4574_00590 [Candidatus Latescibacterota bacterium]